MAKLLIADDDSHVRLLVRRILEAESHEVIEAGDGQNALEQISAHSPDVVLLDVKMPRLDGLRVLRQLQEDGKNQKVIMLTGQTDEEDFLRGLGAGALDYLTKPFEPDDLVGAVNRILSSSNEELGKTREREIDRARLLRQIDRFLD